MKILGLKALYFYLVLGVLCVLSRMLSSIFYIEDPDSLRFALAVLDYDLSKMQPHFPAYPVFCVLAKLGYSLLGKFALSFSLIGAASTIAIIFSWSEIGKRLGIPIWLLSLLLFFNPLIWLMANRYMPDLSGLAFVSLIWWVYFKLEDSDLQNRKIWLAAIAILVGLLAGVRLSYLPMVLIPSLYLFLREPGRLSLLFWGFLSVIIWFLPLLLITGWEELLLSAGRQTEGHFYDFGGTVMGEGSGDNRILLFLRHWWADGIGAYWPGRSFLSLFSTIGVLAGLISLVGFGGKKLIKLFVEKKASPWLILAASLLLYGLWIYFFQNVLFKSRHHLPLIPPVLLLTAYGWSKLIKRNLLNNILLIIFLSGLSVQTIYLVMQHKRPAAISQTVQWFKEKEDPRQIIICSDLVRYCLQKQGVKADFHEINERPALLEMWIKSDQEVFLIGNLERYHDYELVLDTTFFHNPYVNRMWPVIAVNRFKEGE